MKPSELKETLLICAKKGKPVLIKGSPGVGKTDICNQVANELGMDFISVIPCLMDPTDPKGVIGKVNNHYEWMLAGDAKRIAEATKPTLVLIDDVIQAPPSIQAAIMQWPLLRRIGEHKIPDCVTIFAATNRRQDKAGGTGVIEPFKSRFNCIIELVADREDWVMWAYENDMPDWLIGWVYHTNCICDDIATLDLINHCSPRTTAKLGENYNIGLKDVRIFCGTVGEGRGIEAHSYEKMFSQLPNINQVIAEPEKAAIPTELSAISMVCSALVRQVNKSNFVNISKYAKRLKPEFEAMIMTLCPKRENTLYNTKPYTEWCLRTERGIKHVH